MSVRWPEDRRLAYWTERVGEDEAKVQVRRERYDAIYRARNCGLTYREIGEVFGISGGRVQQITHKIVRARRKKLPNGEEYFDAARVAGSLLDDDAALEFFNITPVNSLPRLITVEDAEAVSLKELERRLAELEREASNVRRRIAMMQSERRAKKSTPANAKKLIESDLPNRIVSVLGDAGVYRLCDVETWSAGDFLKVKGFSKDNLHAFWEATGMPNDFKKWLDDQCRYSTAWHQKKFPVRREYSANPRPAAYEFPEAAPIATAEWRLDRLTPEALAPQSPGESNDAYAKRMARMKAAKAHLGRQQASN